MALQQSQLDRFFEALYQEGKIEWVQDHGYFFVDMWYCADLKMLKLMLGIQNGAGVKCSCTFCMVEKQHLGDPNATCEERTAADMEPILKNMTLDRILVCGLHCTNRLAEHLVKTLIKIIWISGGVNDGKAFLHIMNIDLRINGGYCTIAPKAKEGKTGPGKIPLGGEDRVRVFTSNTSLHTVFAFVQYHEVCLYGDYYLVTKRFNMQILKYRILIEYLAVVQMHLPL